MLQEELALSIQAFNDIRDKGEERTKMQQQQQRQQDSISLASFNSSASRTSRYSVSVLLPSEMEDIRSHHGDGGSGTKKRRRRRHFMNPRQRKQRRNLKIRRNADDANSVASDADTVSGASVALPLNGSESDLSMVEGAIEMQRMEPGVRAVMEKLAAMSPEASLAPTTATAAPNSELNSISVQTSLTDLRASPVTANARSCDASTQCDNSDPTRRHVEVDAVVTRTDDASSSANTSGSELRGLSLLGGRCGMSSSSAWPGVAHQHNPARRGGIVDLHGMEAGFAASAMSRPLVDSSSTS